MADEEQLRVPSEAEPKEWTGPTIIGNAHEIEFEEESQMEMSHPIQPPLGPDEEAKNERNRGLSRTPKSRAKRSARRTPKKN